MKKYYCPTCKVEVDTSECPNCNQRTISLRKVYWCDECNSPIIDGERISIRIKDLKQLDDKAIRNEYIRYSAENSSVGFDKYIDRFIQLNNRHYERITVASQFIWKKVSMFYTK